MSTSPEPPSNYPPPSTPPADAAPEGVVEGIGKAAEIKLISHSNLFYWWPVWALSFFMALWTMIEGSRLAIVPPGTKVSTVGDGNFVLEMPENSKTGTESLRHAAATSKYNTDSGQHEPTFKAKMSEKSGLGTAWIIGLILTIVITNVPMRGLWSFIVIVLVVVVALLIILFEVQDKIFNAIGNLHIHINMAGYLFIGVSVFIVWGLATYLFDRRSYIIFTPGQIRVCEHIGASVQAYSTMGVSLEKQRDDLFRHYILGFGSGDLIVHLGGSNGREIRMPNVLGVGWRLKSIEDMLRQVATTA